MSETAVDVAAVSKHLKLHPQTVYLLARSGDIPGFRVGRAWRFFLSEVDAHVRGDDRVQSPQSRGRKRAA